MVERAVQMIESSVVEIMRRAMLDPQVDMEALKSEVNVDKFLSQIYYFRIHDVSEQVAVINTLEKFMIEHGQVGTCTSGPNARCHFRATVLIFSDLTRLDNSVLFRALTFVRFKTKFSDLHEATPR